MAAEGCRATVGAHLSRAHKRGIQSVSFRSAVPFPPGFDWFVAPGHELRGGQDVLVDLEEAVGIVLLVESREPPVVYRVRSANCRRPLIAEIVYVSIRCAKALEHRCEPPRPI